MIKDRNLKIQLTKYFIQKFWYPQMEVDVLSKQRLSSNKKLITDIDVLGLYPDVTGNLEMVLGDCKTLKGQSPISRALWLKGLMDYTSARRGIILLTKKKGIEKEHQITASHLDVQLLSESDFDIFSKSTADYLVTIQSALGEGDNWDAFFEIDKKFPPLKDMLSFSRWAFWNESASNTKLRHAIYVSKKVRGELNPSNPLHLAVVLNHLSLVAIAVNEIISKTFNRHLLPDSKQELDSDLKGIIWGGIENYEYLNDLRRAFTNSPIGENDLKLPEWDIFMEFIRTTLENPLSFSRLPLFLKELAFCSLSSNTYNYAKLISDQDKYIATFAIRLTNYMIKATNLPPDFNDIISEKILSVS